MRIGLSRYVLVFTATFILWLGRLCSAVEDHPPLYGPVGAADATPLYTQIAPNYQAKRDPCIVNWYTDDEAQGIRHQAWQANKTLHWYRTDAHLRHSGVADADWVCYWDDYLGAYGPAGTIGDGSLWIINSIYHFGGVGQLPEYSPPIDGTIDHTVIWWDDTNPAQDTGKSDTIQISVVNNTYPGESYIIAGGHYLARRWIDYYDPNHASGASIDNGRFHIQAGSAAQVIEKRRSLSYKIDYMTGARTTIPLDAGEVNSMDLFAPADNPQSGRRTFYSTAQPIFIQYNCNHANIPNMLPPSNNAIFQASVVVTDVQFVHPNPPTAPGLTVSLGYNLLPSQTVLDAKDNPKAVRLYIWDPANPNYGRFWTSNGLSDRFTWDGILFSNNGYGPDYSYLRACNYFMSIEWRVRDNDWDTYVGVHFDTQTYFKTEDRLIFDVHAEDTFPPANVREISAGGIPNPVHRTTLNIYTNPAKAFTATISMTGGLGVEPTVYPYLGQNYKLGQKVDARITAGGQTYPAGNPSPIVVYSAFGAVIGSLQSSNHPDLVNVNVTLSGGLGYHSAAVNILQPNILLEMPLKLFPQTPEVTSATLSIGPNRRVPGHELLFNVDGLTFKDGMRLNWFTDAYLRNKPQRLERFVQVRTNNGMNITTTSDDDGFASAAVTIVEPLLGISNVEVRVLDGSVER